MKTAQLLLFAGICFLLTACASNPEMRDQLTAGENQLMGRQYDQALRSADTVLASKDDSLTAEAFYLRGRAVEDRPKRDRGAAATDLAEARKDYNAGLTHSPSPAVEVRLHMMIGNCAFHQDDYAPALRELSIAYEQLDKPEWKQWVLYRIAMCEQRLQRFADADKTYALVQQQYPGTEPARRSHLRQGVHAFYVQVGAFSSQADIDTAAATIVSAGSLPMKTTDKQTTIVRTANMPSYKEARAVQNALLANYPDATILP